MVCGAVLPPGCMPSASGVVMHANGSAQELAEGKSLAQLMAEGWRADEAEVTRIALELLGILQYLGSRRPAVVHRQTPDPQIACAPSCLSSPCAASDGPPLRREVLPQCCCVLADKMPA